MPLAVVLVAPQTVPQMVLLTVLPMAQLTAQLMAQLMVARPAPAVEMVEGFGGASIEGDTFTFPSGSEVWAGFANLNTDIYPFTFASGGTITFTAAIPAGGSDTQLYFRFERLPYPDTEPSFNLDPVTISGETEQQYSVTIPHRMQPIPTSLS